MASALHIPVFPFDLLLYDPKSIPRVETHAMTLTHHHALGKGYLKGGTAGVQPPEPFQWTASMQLNVDVDEDLPRQVVVLFSALK